MDKGTIFFYDRPSRRVMQENIFLNNFFHSPFIVDGKEYNTVEHYYQSLKFSGEISERVRLAPTPNEAKILSRQFSHDKNEWALIRDQVMRTALEAKFGQNPELREKLIETGNCKLVEDSERDAYWGGVTEGSCNRLGELLEELREEYRALLKFDNKDL